MSEHVSYSTTVVFADVSGSSKLYKEVGNDEANRRIGDIVKRCCDVVQTNKGVVIKTIGDEVMCHFRDANDAHVASIAIQRIGEQTLPMRIGMAYGTVIEKDKDLFGEAVNDAAAVAKIARGKQTISTEGFRAQLTADHQKKLSHFDEVKLKGGQASTKLYRTEWEGTTQSIAKQTVIMASISAIHNQLSISYSTADGQRGTHTLTAQSGPFHIGRDAETCQLAIATPLASRDHCHIQYQYGKFVLVDHSTNGTWVKTSNDQQVYLRREELPLLGSGSIGLGEQIADNNAYVIRFQS